MYEYFRKPETGRGPDFSVNPLILVFNDRELEERFLKNHISSNLQLGRACHLIAVFFYSLFALWDVLIIDPSRISLWIKIVPPVSLVFLAGLASSYLAIEFYARFWRHLYVIYVLITGLGFTAFIVFADTELPVHSFVGIIFCLLFCYSYIRLTFLQAAIAGTSIALIYIVASWRFAGMTDSNLLSEVFYLSGINLLGIMICYSLDLLSRRDFVLNRMLEREEEKTRNINLQLEQVVEERTGKLRESEEFNRSIIENSLDCIKILDLEGNLKFMSNGGQALLEIEDIELFLNKSWIDIWEGEDQQKALDAVELAGSGEIGFFEGFCPTNKGNPKWWSVTVSPVRGPEGKVMELLAVSRDITEQKELEERYVKAQKMEAIGRLAGGVAHDLNNTLSVVIGYSELALEKISEDDPLHSDLNEVFNAARRSTATVGQLLAFARRQTIAPRKLNLNETIENMLRMLRSLIGEDIDLVWKPAVSLYPVEMDPSQVDQILANLMVNARDAISDVGRVIIATGNVSLDEEYCRDYPELVPGDYALLSVSDDGCGMDSETQRQVFEPYFTTKEVGKGSGLGLATVFGIVNQNNGLIDVESEPGEGSTFRIYLPKYKGKVSDIQGFEAAELPMGRGETILVVEDEAQILKLCQRMLGNLGYQVIGAAKPEEAMQMASDHAPNIDLLITDVVMPEMNGRELAEQLMGSFPDLKTLFMSGYSADVIANRGVLGEGIRFLQKPFTSHDLAVQVRSALDE